MTPVMLRLIPAAAGPWWCSVASISGRNPPIPMNAAVTAARSATTPPIPHAARRVPRAAAAAR